MYPAYMGPFHMDCLPVHLQEQKKGADERDFVHSLDTALPVTVLVYVSSVSGK